MYQYLNDSQKRKIFNAVFASLIFLAIFLAIKSLNSLKENSYIGKGVYSTNVISVTGTGEVLTKPDVGSFTFSVVEEGKSVKEAQDKASNKINSVLGAIKSLGVLEKDIKTISYNFYPKYEYSRSEMCTNGYCPPGKQVLVGHEVSQTISVKIRNTEKAGEALTKVGALGVSNLSGLDFVVDDMDKVNAEARDKAISDAKSKAKILSKSLGVSLTKIVNFYESGSQPPIMYAMGGMEAKSADVMSSPVPQIPTGENKVVSNVTITYEVR